jgi:hypothetical protein
MRALIRHLAMAGLFLATAGAAVAAVTVTYAHPEHYADLPFPARDREQVLKSLAEHFNQLGQALPPGENLKVEVLDLNLAGELRPSVRSGQDIRILHGGADWPQMRLRYAVESGGKVISSGEDQLDNMMYLNRVNRYSDGDSLRYEKQMIDDWFRKAILAHHPG